MSLAIHGIGLAVPPGVVNQAEATACARLMSGAEIRDARWLSAVYSHSGVRTRHQVLGRPLVDDLLAGTRLSGSPFLPGESSNGPTTGERMLMYAEEAAPLAIRAATQALSESRFPPESFTHIVTVSCTGFFSPGVDYALIRSLDLRPTIERTHIGFMGCHAALNGLRVANSFATANPDARVLLVAVELCSLHYHCGNDPAKAVANAIFADGAAAIAGTGSGLSSGNRPWSVAATGSCLIPDSADAMGWTVGDFGFEMMLAKSIPTLIARHIKPWLIDWLGKLDMKLEMVRSWAVHPGGPKILSAVEEGIELPRDALTSSREIYSTHGNMSSPTVLFVLDRMRRMGAPRPCVALGFGPGLVAEAVLLV